jgi:hypothetical protein
VAAKKKALKRKAVTKKVVARSSKHAQKRAPDRVDTTSLLHELIGRCVKLRDSGQLSKARKAFAQVERLQKALEAMEAAMRGSPPGDKRSK